MPIRHTVPKPCSQPSNRAYPAGVAANSCTPSRPPIVSSAAAIWVSAWVSTPPVTARASSTMVTVIPFVVEGWHAPAGRRTWQPRPLAQARQIRPATRWVPKEPGPGRQVDSKDSPVGVSRFGGQAGTQATGPYAQTNPKPRKQGRSTIHILPADYVLWRLAACTLKGMRRSTGSGAPLSGAGFSLVVSSAGFLAMSDHGRRFSGPTVADLPKAGLLGGRLVSGGGGP